MKEPGEIIKALSIVVLIISVVATFFYAITYALYTNILVGFIILILGLFGSYFSFILVYGFGDLITTSVENKEINAENQKILKGISAKCSDINDKTASEKSDK